MQHPVQDLAAHQRLNSLPLPATSPQSGTKYPLESPDAILRPRLLMLPGLSSPLSAPHLLDSPKVTIAHPRPSAPHRDGAVPQWDHDTCTALGGELPDVAAVVGTVRCHPLQATAYLSEQSRKRRRVGDIAVGQLCRDDLTFVVHPKMELAPTCLLA